MVMSIVLSNTLRMYAMAIKPIILSIRVYIIHHILSNLIEFNCMNPLLIRHETQRSVIIDCSRFLYSVL